MSTTRTNTTKQELEENYTEDSRHGCHLYLLNEIPINNIINIWSNEKYIEVMIAIYNTPINPKTAKTPKAAYNIW